MSLPNKKLAEIEFKKDVVSYQKIIPHEENWHNGETFKYLLELNESDIRYYQFKTIAESKKCFIYDEVIKRENKSVFLLNLHNDEKKEIWELMIYFKNNEIIQQIRHLSYNEFFEEVENNVDTIKKMEENDTTTIIKTPFLKFINKINEEEKQDNNNDSNNINHELLKRNRRKWIAVKCGIFCFSWVGIGLLAIALGFAFSPLIAPLAALMGNGAIATAGASAVFGTITTIVSGITVGIIVKQWNKRKHKWKKRWLPNWKSKSEIANDMKLQEEKNKIEAKMQNELYLSLTDDQKQKRIFNAFKENINKDKNKDFETLSQELNDKFKENKLNLVTINYEQELKKINENQISLKDNPEHIIEEAYKGYYPKIFAN